MDIESRVENLCFDFYGKMYNVHDAVIVDYENIRDQISEEIINYDIFLTILKKHPPNNCLYIVEKNCLIGIFCNRYLLNVTMDTDRGNDLLHDFVTNNNVVFTSGTEPMFIALLKRNPTKGAHKTV